MKITNIEIHNILSIEHANLSFDDRGLVLVEGFDYDSGRANGAGKSAIFNSISYGLFDKIPRNITKSEILRYGTKAGFVFVSVTTDSGENLGVKRSRPSGLEFFKDGSKIDITQTEFESKIGINYDQFLSTMYNAQDSKERFISLDDRGKKDFILKIMNLESFDEKRKTLSTELSSITSQKAILNTKIEGHKNSLAIYKNQIVDVVDIEGKIRLTEAEILHLISRVSALEHTESPDLSKYAEIENQIEQKLHSFVGIRYSIDQKKKELQSLVNKKPSAHCPDCGVGLNSVGGHLIKAEDETGINEKAGLLISEIKSLEESLLKENDIKEMSKKLKQKKMDEYQEYNAAQIAANNLRNSVASKRREIESYKDQLSRNDTVKSNMQTIIDEILASQNILLSLTGEEDLIKTVMSFFDPTGAPAYIMDSVIDSFNDAMSDYVATIWPNATYALQSYKENKDKSISTKFSESLSIGGSQRSVGSLSGGEFRALSLATDFAIVDVLASKFSIDLNPVILDEPFNGLDISGKELVIDLLDKISTRRQVWVVDHSSESKALFSRVVRVEKKNGISSIKDV